MPPTPKNLILSLLMAAPDLSLSSRQAVGACAMFGISENSVRVTLVRLVSAGLLETATRGSYRLGPQAEGIASELSRWRQKEERACEWQGQWLVASTGALSRSDRTALRSRERALAMTGFRALDDALHIRPDNIVGHARHLRERLGRLGLGQDVPVFSAADFDDVREAHARQLWDGPTLNAGYVRLRLQLERWMADNAHQPAQMAARECYLLGNEGIRAVVFDPLLPEPLVDVEARRACFEAVRRIDETGHRIWRGLLQQLADGVISPTDLRQQSGLDGADDTATEEDPSAEESL